MSRMKILHVARMVYEPQNGVIAIVPQHLYHQSAYADVALLNIRAYTPEGDEAAVFSTYYYQDYTHLSALPDGFATPDLVVFHEIYWPEFLKIYPYFKKAGIPYIVIPHGASNKVAQRRRFLKKILGNLFFFNSFVNSAAAVHYLSDFDRKHSVFSNPRTIVQGSGIPLHKERKTKFSPSGLKLIYIGRLDVVVKGLDIMLEMAKKYRDSLREHGVTITIAGSNSSGGQQIISDFIIHHELQDIVFLEPPIFGDDKVKKLLNNDVFFQLSRTEAQSLGVSEAMNLGMPTLVTPGTSFYERAVEHGIAIPVKTEDDIHNAIMRALDDKIHLKVIGERAAAFIEEHYAWPRVARRIFDAYERIIKTRQRSI